VTYAWDVLLARLGKVSAGDLPPALQQVAHDGALAQLVPVLQGPAELVDGGGHEDGRVGHAAGDDHVRDLLQRLENAIHAHVGVGGHDLARELGQGLVGLPHLGVHVLVNDGEQVLSATIYTKQEADGILFLADGDVRMDVVKYCLYERAFSC